MGKLLYRIIPGISKGALVPCGLRLKLLRLVRVKCANSVTLSCRIDFESPNVTIDSGSLINKSCKLYVGDGNITIGRNVFIASDVILNCLTHNIGASEQRAQDGTIYGDIRRLDE